MADAERLVVRVGDRLFSLSLAQVEGVAIAPPISRVPATPPGLLGLTNLRGSVLPVVDADPGGSGERRHLVVLIGRELGRFALACDWVEELDSGTEPATALDADAVGAAVVAAFDEIDQTLPGVERPTARIVPRDGSSA